MFRHSIILRDVGGVLKYLSFVFLIPPLIAIFYNETLIFFLFVLIFGSVYLIGSFLNSYFKSLEEIKLSESMATVALVWLLAAFFSSLPFLFFGSNFLDAFFESMSAWTTTGLSVIDIEAMPMSLLFWRSLMQWVGGLGIVVVALVGLFRTSGSLYLAESRDEQIKPNIFNTVKTMWWIYVGYTLLGIIALKIAGMNLFDAVNHSFTAIATGGMSTHANGVAEFNSLSIEIILMFLMVLGAVSFLTHFLILKGKRFYKDIQLTWLIGLIVIFSILLLFKVDLRSSVFHVISALTGTGFNIVNLNSWPEVSKYLLVILMIVGGSAGSTAGGLKLIRLATFLKSIWWRIKKIVRPHLVTVQEVGQVKFSEGDVLAILRFIGLFFLILVISSIVLMLNGHSLMDALFQTSTAMGSVGLSTVDTFNSLDKIVLVVVMWLGRLEIWPVLMLFYVIFKIKK